MSRISRSLGSPDIPNPPNSLNRLLSDVAALKGGNVGKLVCTRIQEFEAAIQGQDGGIFRELCFCILTANFNAEKSIKIQNKIGDGFLTLSELQLARKLKELGHRYPNVRAKYIVEARKYKNALNDAVVSCDDEHELREWLVKNIKGIGYKEASHFIRNIGYKNSAIVDFHIIDLLVRSGLIERPKTLTKAKYLEIEGVLGTIAAKLDMNLAELDLYLWFIETGTVLK